jgi:hypothetical protein
MPLMNWIETVLRWRALPPETKQRLRQDAIPADVAESMAFEGEPVSETTIREQLCQIVPPDSSKPPATSSQTPH